MIEEEVAEIMSQLLSAINYCHSRKIIHRDIRPENILIESTTKGKLNIKIINCGIADVLYPDLPIRQAWEAFPYYMAPEALDKRYTDKSDIWSCGAIMYTMLYGKPPFYEDSIDKLAKAMSKGITILEGKIWDDLSKDVRDLLVKMLNASSAKRIAAMGAFTHRWTQNRQIPPPNKENEKVILTDLARFLVL